MAGQHPGRRHHAGYVLGGRLAEHEDRPLGIRLGGGGVEDDRAGRRPWRGAAPDGDGDGVTGEQPVVEHLLEPGGVDPQQRLGPGQPSGSGQVDGDLDGGACPPLAGSRFEQPEAVVLRHEVDAHHVPVGSLEGADDVAQHTRRLRCHRTHGVQVAERGAVVVFGSGGESDGRHGTTGFGVAAEHHPGARSLPDRTERHGMDDDAGAQLVGDPVPAAPPPRRVASHEANTASMASAS